MPYSVKDPRNAILAGRKEMRAALGAKAAPADEQQLVSMGIDQRTITEYRRGRSD